MNLPGAPAAYTREVMQSILEAIRREDQSNFKKGQDVRLERGERLILKSANGTLYKVVVSDAGVLSTVAV